MQGLSLSIAFCVTQARTSTGQQNLSIESFPQTPCMGCILSCTEHQERSIFRNFVQQHFNLTWIQAIGYLPTTCCNAAAILGQACHAERISKLMSCTLSFDALHVDLDM